MNKAVIYKIIIALLLIAQPLCGQTVPENGYIIDADEVILINESQQIFRGNVKLAFRNSIVRADEVRVYRDMNIISASGNVHIQDEFHELRADRVTYDLNLETGMVDNVSGLLNGEFYVCAQYMHKLGRQFYILEGARVTTCEAPLPDWSFSFSRVEAEIDGYLFGNHATMNIKDMPFAYLPKVFFPLKVTRQTGFLIPRIGYSTDLGYFYNQNFFWAIDYDKDMTLGANYFSERGVQGLLEMRYVASRDTYVYMAGDFIRDMKEDVIEDTRWSYVSKSKVSAYGLEFVADANFVSDFRYMRDFGTYRLFGNEWGNYENVFYQHYEIGWDNKWADFSIFYNESKKYRDTDTGFLQTVVAQEPSIAVQKYNMDIGFLNADYSVVFDNIYYKSNQFSFNNPDIVTNGRHNRIHAEASLYYPVHLSALSITPSITGYYTRWNEPDESFQIAEQKHTIYSLRETGNGFERMLQRYSVQVDVNEIYRRYGTSGNHSIVNTFTYDYIPELEQAGLPEFLNDDIIEPIHEVGWNLTNYFRGKSWRGELSFRQQVDVRIDEQPFQPLEIRGNFAAKGFLYDAFEIKYSYYPDEIESRNGDAIIFFSNDIRFFYNNYSLYISYNYDNLVPTTDFNTNFTVGGGFDIYKVRADSYVTWKANNNYISMDGLVPVENRVSLVWNEQCWSLGLSYYTERSIEVTSSGRESKRDHTVELIISLKGLGQQNIRTFHYEDDGRDI